MKSLLFSDDMPGCRKFKNDLQSNYENNSKFHKVIINEVNKQKSIVFLYNQHKQLENKKFSSYTIILDWILEEKQET